MKKTVTAKRLAKPTWERIRRDHEIRGMSFYELEQRYEVNRSSIKRKADNQGWNREKVQRTINHQVLNKTGLKEATEHIRLIIDNTQNPPKYATKYVDEAIKEISDRGRIIELIMSGSLKGMGLLNSLLYDAIAENERIKHSEATSSEKLQQRTELLLPILEAHSKFALSYSAATFGKNGLPTIEPKQGKTEQKRREVVEKLKEKHRESITNRVKGG